MTDPFDSPTGRWGLIFYGNGLYRRAHTRLEWAQIADAIAAADVRHGDSMRGGDAWCATAVDTFSMLRDVDAYAQLRSDDHPVWHADERLIRAWLGAPTIPVELPGETVLHEHGWHETLGRDRRVDLADLSMLVDLAQDAGVVGEPLHKVNLLRWVNDGAFSDDSFLVLVWRPDGPALPSAPVGLDQLIGAGGSATDRAVAVLSGVAAVANHLLATAPPDRAPATAVKRERPAADAVHEQPVRRGGRAFRLIAGAGNADPPTPPPPPPARSPRHPRT
jgi:hypothetical protein